MPRLAAMKHPNWTGRHVVIHSDRRPNVVVRLDGWIYGPRLTGREVERRHVRWFFQKGPDDDGPPRLGLPPWCELVERV